MKGKKTGGRQKGTPNKATNTIKTVISEFVSDYFNSKLFSEDLKKLEPKERFDVIIKMAGFVVPKPQTIALDMTQEAQETIEDMLVRLANLNE